MQRLDLDVIMKTLVVWEATFGNGRELVTVDLAKVWLGVMNARQVTADEWDRASLEIMGGNTFIPKPAEVLTLIERYRRDAKALNEREFWASLVEAKTKDGQMILAPYYRVSDDGRLLPEGQRNDRALHPREALALQARQPKALEAPSTSPEDRIAQIRRMKPGAAAQFVAILKASGQDVTAELEALKELKAAEEARLAAEAEQRDAEHYARIQAQIKARRANRE